MGKKKFRSSKRKSVTEQKRELPLEKLRMEADFIKYMKLLKAFAKKYCVMIVVNDTPVGPATTQDVTAALMGIGLRIDLYGRYRCAYAAMIDAGKVVFEQLNVNTLEAISKEIVVGTKKVKLVSAGFNAGIRKASIWIDGKDYAHNKRGLNIVVYDKTTETILDSVSFDTYEPEIPRLSSYTSLLRLKEFIEAHPNVSVVSARFPEFPANAVTPGDRFIQEQRLAYTSILQNLHRHIFTLNTYFDEAGIVEVLGTPKSYFDFNGVRRFEDVHGKYLNTSGGHRETSYQPERPQRTIFMLGGCTVFGIGSDDGRTVASYLQQQCNLHVPDAGAIVQNYGFFLGDRTQDDELAKLIDSLPVKPGDIIIYQNNMNLYIEDVPCIDLLHAAEEPRDYEMFFDCGHFTPDGNRMIAEGLFKGLMDLGFLHSFPISGQEQNKAVTDDTPGSDLRGSHDFADYLKLLKKYAQKYCVLVSSWDIPSGTDFTETIFGLYREVGFLADLTGKPDRAYAAAIDGGELVYEELCEDGTQMIDVTLTDDDPLFQADLVSKGYDTEAPDEKTPIEVNGNKYFPKRRGLHFVVYDKTEQIAIDAVNFDISLDPVPCYRAPEYIPGGASLLGCTPKDVPNKADAGGPASADRPAAEVTQKGLPFEKGTYKELTEYKKALTDWYDRTFSITIGSVVMNCNPFTLGHYYLVEKALAQCDFLIIFVVQEDKSRFPFEDRLRLVKEGVADLKNVAVLPSGKFVLSSLTFSEYFNKSELQDRIIDTSLDVTVFAREIAPCLHITKRFAGEEPFDAVTRQYNETMRRILPEYGIEFVEIPRAADVQRGTVISASRVRELLEKKDFDSIRPLVPESTFHYLKQL